MFRLYKSPYSGARGTGNHLLVVRIDMAESMVVMSEDFQTRICKYETRVLDTTPINIDWIR